MTTESVARSLSTNYLGFNFKQPPSTHSVIAGLDPAIHLLRKMVSRRLMDARVKPGHDECRHLDSRHTFTPSPRHAPEPLMNLPPKEGVGNAGCPLHPRPRVHLVVVERTRVTTSTRNHPASPHAMVLTVSFVLSPAIGLVCHRRQRICLV